MTGTSQARPGIFSRLEISWIALFLALAFLAPYVVHFIPSWDDSPIGGKFLPIFYAPLIAALTRKAHVSIVVAVMAPWMNHVLIGMPPLLMAVIMTGRNRSPQPSMSAWRRSTDDNPTGICGPIGPTEQLPLVARLVNELDLALTHCHFWGMDEWVDEQGQPVPASHPLSFAKADMELCFNRIRSELRLPESPFSPGSQGRFCEERPDGR